VRSLAVAVVLFACALCAGAAGAHRFAGLTGRAAAAQATAVVRTFAPSMFGYEDASAFRHVALVDVSRSLDSARREAWLALFRYPGGHDAACVWIRRATSGPWRYSFEEAQSVANGRSPERVHDRCAAIAFRRHLLAPDDTGGLLGPTPSYAYPEPVSPLGPVARGSYLADLEDTDGASLTGAPAKLPQATAPGTSGVEGFVIDERTWRVIPGAIVAVALSTKLSGFSRVPAGRFRPVLEVTTDRHGAFAILDLPARKLGYDFVVTAPGYAAAYDVHDLSLPGLFVGDYSLARHPRFVDSTLGPPPCGTGC
jgi:hypothetical protein